MANTSRICSDETPLIALTTKMRERLIFTPVWRFSPDQPASRRQRLDRSSRRPTQAANADDLMAIDFYFMIFFLHIFDKRELEPTLICRLSGWMILLQYSRF